VSLEADGNPEPPGYEQARAELEQVVRQLEQGSMTLEQTLTLWERGEALATICEAWLEGAQTRLAAAQGSADRAGD
jgi:exodeoxyribonuclease VII small subunit